MHAEMGWGRWWCQLGGHPRLTEWPLSARPGAVRHFQGKGSFAHKYGLQCLRGKGQADRSG